MSMFGRRKKGQPPAEGADPAASSDTAELAESADAAADAVPVEPVRPQGPWDVADAPEDSVDRLDLGGLQIPVPPGTEVRVDVNPEGQVMAATIVAGPSGMQLSAFAAPRRAGIWDEVRSEIAEQLRSGGGQAVDVEGPYGTELHAGVPTEVPGQGRLLAPARFLGVDGPRWFVRALVTGPAVVDAEAAGPLMQALKSVVVVRGSEAMAVRDPLPLRLPANVTTAAASAAAARAQEEQGQELAQEQQEQGQEQPPERPAPPSPPERGPEIAELR
jgi:hypothetical protein